MLDKEPLVLFRGACSLIFLAAIFSLGCSKRGGMETAPVSGKVAYRGKAVPTGTVMFVPAEGPAATGEIAKDGTYTLTTYKAGDGAVIGKHKVTITALEGMGESLPEQRSPTPPPLIPAKYLSDTTSGLTADVKAGTTNQINFDLTD
jgi:hypothetical protein